MMAASSEIGLSPLTAGKLVAVEGKDDLNLLSALRDHLGIQDMEIRHLGGKSSYSAKLRALSITPGFMSVVSFGVMRDADSSASAAFQSVCDALRNSGLPVPAKPLVPTETPEGKPRVVVLVVPHGASNGMLEDICLQSVGQDPAMACVDTYFECLLRGLGKIPTNLSKAKVHAFLSSRDQPDLRLGEAACAKYWPWCHEAFDHVRQFLSLL